MITTACVQQCVVPVSMGLLTISGSAGRRDAEEMEEFFAQQVAPILDQMAALSKSESLSTLGIANIIS